MFFVCVEVLWPSQPNGIMSSAVSLPNHTFTGQAQSSKGLTSIVHTLSPETDNCPSWISWRKRMTIENISWTISMKEYCQPSRGRTSSLLITSHMRIQLSHQGQTQCMFLWRLRKIFTLFRRQKCTLSGAMVNMGSFFFFLSFYNPCHAD